MVDAENGERDSDDRRHGALAARVASRTKLATTIGRAWGAATAVVSNQHICAMPKAKRIQYLTSIDKNYRRLRSYMKEWLNCVLPLFDQRLAVQSLAKT